MVFEITHVFHKKFGLIYIIIIVLLDYFFRKKERLNYNINNIIENTIFSIIIISIIYLFSKPSDFIYFQF